MAPKVQIKRTSTVNGAPTALLPGELAVEMADPSRLWVGVPANIDATLRKLLTGKSIVAASSPPNPASGLLWWNTATSKLMIYLGSTWTEVAPAAAVPGTIDAYTKGESDARYVNITGDSMTGSLGVTGTVTATGGIASQTGSLYAATGAAFATAASPAFSAFRQGTQNIYQFSGNNYISMVDGSNTMSVVVGGTQSAYFAPGSVTIYPAELRQGSGLAHTIFGFDKGVNSPSGIITRAGTGRVSRWWLQTGNGEYEGGGNSGCNYQLNAYDDWGTELNGGYPYLQIFRAHGWVTHYGLRFQTSTLGIQPGGGLWGDSSDLRIKKVRGKYTQGLDAIKKLNPVRFEFRGNVALTRREEEESDSKISRFIPSHKDVVGKEYIGLVAQEAEESMPELVTKETGWIDEKEVKDLRMMNGTPLIYALINAVKELSAKIEAIETRLPQLKVN